MLFKNGDHVIINTPDIDELNNLTGKIVGCSGLSYTVLFENAQYNGWDAITLPYWSLTKLE